MDQATQTQLRALLDNMGDAYFACGEHDRATAEDSYESVSAAAQAARAAVEDFVRGLAAGGCAERRS